MSIEWKVAGVLLAGLYDPELRRWKWGGERWSWPWVRAGSDIDQPTRSA